VVSLAQQLQGKLDWSGEGGARFALRFVPEEHEKRRLPRAA